MGGGPFDCFILLCTAQRLSCRVVSPRPSLRVTARDRPHWRRSRELEAARYAALLAQHPLDVCILGVGENGHIAFNDPGVADFDDAVLAKVIDLDERSRMQQVNDGCFARIEEVPKKAITVTIPGLTGAKYLYCSVPCATKAQAIGRMFTGEIALDCPATVLRRTPNSFVYLDKDSAAMLL